MLVWPVKHVRRSTLVFGKYKQTEVEGVLEVDCWLTAKTQSRAHPIIKSLEN